MTPKSLWTTVAVLCLFVSGFVVLFLPSCTNRLAEKNPNPSSKDNRTESPKKHVEFTPIAIAKIQKGIEKHIAEQVRRGKGYFHLSFKEKELRLKLVRVHTEYLSHLTPQTYFACVDLVDVSGDVYDVDFFLAGKPDTMKVTSTTVHKLNGQPYYLWKQKSDETWVRVPVEKASVRELGVIPNRDRFVFVYKATLPQLTGPARMWIPVPTTNTFQTVKILSLRAPGKQRMLKGRNSKNKILFHELSPRDSKQTVEIRYRVQRREKKAYVSKNEADNPQKHLKHLPGIDPQKFSSIIKKVLKGKKSDLVRARALYDHVIDHIKYQKVGSNYGTGDANFACDSASGNCTEYHSYFIALSRAAGIPARFAIGAGIPSSRNNGGIDGYHCWAEFYAEGKWWPVDISEGDKYTPLATYYFGHNPANRIEFSRGRQIVVKPGPASGPIDFHGYPILEINKKPVRVKVEFSFIRKEG